VQKGDDDDDDDDNNNNNNNSGFIQCTPHEAQYNSEPVALTFASHSKKLRNLFFQPSLRASNDLRIGRKMATFQIFFQSGNRWQCDGA